ncbi:nadh-ubiquinone oxidoreductase kda subunit [Trichoderma cornu-damae]|uniref:Nadh-ubiquinone oxidoreductase kDa subunit n=1 Tax=Trichoderma cornu-damae TaxID=654480 RepID=A0A9P8QPU3_9HYPO|nr:nadh-ubiquinone oxidoreductase kda subunit [Trichoderma cornu-damae]
MFAARPRAAWAARQLQRTCRTYASEAHGHHSPAPVNESFGKGSVIALGAFLGTVLVFQFRPQESDTWNGVLAKYRSKAEDWEAINSLHTKAMEQAGYDRNLFENASAKHRYVDISYPEAFQSHAQRNIQAGHLASIDHVVEHYRQQHLKAEEKKAAKLAAAGKEA